MVCVSIGGGGVVPEKKDEPFIHITSPNVVGFLFFFIKGEILKKSIF